MPWEPDVYLRFADHRARPGYELLARIPDVSPSLIVDLGCGTGSLTGALEERWPTAEVIGIDSSAEMIAKASATQYRVDWKIADISDWEPTRPVDVIYSNATLHWLDDHRHLFSRLRSYLAPGGVLAVQMPDNWRAPTHQVLVDTIDNGEWPQAARDALMRDRLSAQHEYAAWVQPAELDMWRTTYFQQLEGDDPVWTWVSGAILVPVLAELSDAEQKQFEQAVKQAYRVAYPQGPDGRTTVGFSRLFLVARAITS
ncbi:MAG: methyltransferase domain-containing protein [Acidimicrobiia bacterium]|nr:methyltransferase domain-containing protein [Acidimicrobiia bacterium]NNF63454.1 methyltransferase domain-containing protein [Acidimicrobiia bacterium]